MTVHRFMSMAEFQKLLKGETLHNSTNHAKDGYKTSSVGFCFTTDDPDEAIHYLSGNVDTDVCVTFDVKAVQLQKSTALYRNPSMPVPEGKLFVPPLDGEAIEKVEYCTQSYSLQTFHLLKVSTDYQYIPGRAYTQHMMSMVLARETK